MGWIFGDGEEDFAMPQIVGSLPVRGGLDSASDFTGRERSHNTVDGFCIHLSTLSSSRRSACAFLQKHCLAPGWRVSKMRFHGAIFTAKYHHKISPCSILNCLSKYTFGQSHKTSSTKAYYLYITNYVKCQWLPSKL